MKAYTQKELNVIIKKHGKWLRKESGGKRADLSYTDLSDADLSNADLSRANLFHADLTSADMSNANLSHAFLSNAELSDADLSGADLSHADLSHADLSYTNLSNTNLSDADLSNVDLSRANLSYADLTDANLYHANLSGANLFDTFYENNTIVTFKYKKHTAQYMGLNSIEIGCERYSISYWLKNFERIGEKYSYSKEEIKMYGKFIKSCAKDFKNKAKV